MNGIPAVGLDDPDLAGIAAVIVGIVVFQEGARPDAIDDRRAPS
jgi:hypothetical protein